ncbi:MAG: type II secretion system protein [Bacilli bacterium]|nr:type II secretion system protein [Bacilli bacterium]
MKSNFNFALKKKGFTLIELLAVIVILAVIALILTPQILSVINEAKEGSLEATKKSIVKASELYVVSNIEDFTLDVGEKAYIQLSELEDGYIKSIKNTSGESCAGYVKVEKTEEDYDYTVYLDCGNGENLLVDSSYVNYGGDYLDEFQDVIETNDGGYLAVGRSNSSTFSDNARYGDILNYDAIIVKYDSNGLEEWSHNFGGTGNDCFYSVIDDGSGYVVVGIISSIDGDMDDLDASEYDNSVLVKYSYNGNLVNKKIVTKSLTLTGSAATKILYNDNYYYVIGHSRNVLSSSYCTQYIIKYDSNFNKVWTKTYGGNYTAYAYGAIFNSDGDIVIVGSSGSVDGEMSDIKIGDKGNADATIFVVDNNTGAIISKGIFGGTDGSDTFRDVVEVDDGYIVVGYTSSSDNDMNGLYKGSGDAVAIKYSKTANENGVLPIEWIRVIGGTSSDYLKKIFVQDDYIILAGYTNSIDGDLQDISKTLLSDYDGLIVKMDLSGNILLKTTYGGSQSEYLNGGIYSNGKYILVGSSFSLDEDMESFNLGNSDAIMLSIDADLNIIDGFKLETLLMSNQKEIIVDYGTSIPTVEEKDNLKLYTTNDASSDLNKWCTSSSIIDPNSNYNYVPCLKPFDEGNIISLAYQSVSTANLVEINQKENNDWIRLYFNYGNAGNVEMSNLKLNFGDSNYVTVEEAVNLGYIEPLVLSGMIASRSDLVFPNSYNVISGESSGSGYCSGIIILIKTKTQKLTSITFDTNRELTTVQAQIQISEFLNFDISLTPNLN